MSKVFILGTLLLVGCQSEAERAKQRYEFLREQSASARTLCLEAQKVIDAVADERNSAEYTSWSIEQQSQCLKDQELYQ